MRKLPLAVLLVALTVAGTAEAKLLVAPTILGKGLEPARDIIDNAIAEQLRDGQIGRHPNDRFLDVRLQECKNSMSCLAQIAQPQGATLVMHAVLARRGQKVLAQFTLIDVRSGDRLDRVRVKSGVGLSFIEDSVRKAIAKLVLTMQTLPAWASKGELYVPKTGGEQTTVTTKIAEDKTVISGNTTTTKSGGTTETRTTPAGTGGNLGGESAFRAPPPIESTVKMIQGPNYVAYTVGGVGLAAAIGGGVAFVLSGIDLQKRSTTPQTDVQRRNELQNSALNKQTIGAVLLVGSVVALGAGTVFHLTGWGASSYPAAGEGPVVTTGPNGLALYW